jgi:FMN-dependent NADH-azoreductase
MHILHLDSSARGATSLSHQLAKRLADRLQQGAGATLATRHTYGLPFIDEVTVGAYYTPEDQRNQAQRDSIALSDTLVGELEAADVIVAAVPMYNFGVPASFKAWVDLVARVGRTFKYTDKGPVGLLQGKRFYAVVATGGTPLSSELDFVTPYLKAVLGFIGITDVHVVAADQYMPDAAAKLQRGYETVDAVVLESA